MMASETVPRQGSKCFLHPARTEVGRSVLSSSSGHCSRLAARMAPQLLRWPARVGNSLVENLKLLVRAWAVGTS